MALANCKNCNKKFESRPNRGKPTMFCNIKCYWVDMVGKPHGHKTVNGMQAWNKELRMPSIQGKNHFAWKGKNVSYRNLHRWVVRYLGRPSKCELCEKDGLINHKIHWANISHTYKRELTDWIRLCAKCHKQYDIGNIALI